METVIWKLKPSIDLRDKKRNSACAAYNTVVTWHNIVVTWHNTVVTWHNTVVTWHNIEAHSRITVAVEKKKSFTYLCVCVCARARARLGGCVGEQARGRARAHVYLCLSTMQLIRAVLWRQLLRVWLHNIFRHYLISGTIIEKKVQNIKYVFGFSLQLLSKTFLIVRRI